MTNLLILLFVLTVHPGDRINDALDQARAHYAQTGEGTTILIEPGDYEEELTIDVPNLRLINTSARTKDALVVTNSGTSISKNAVRISWYYGHGYQYTSMPPERFNNRESNDRLWNASTLVCAPGFYAEGIIFQNSFSIYVSPAEARDSVIAIPDISKWKASGKNRDMPTRPKTPYSTDVQQRYYTERASAISFTGDAKGCKLKRCRIIGKQDAFYGAHGASIQISHSILQGGVDYIFGGMDLSVEKSLLVAQVNEEKNDGSYIVAGRGYVPGTLTSAGTHLPQASLDSIPTDEYASVGMFFRHCRVRYATADELANPVNLSDPEHVDKHRIQLCRPWRWWGKHTFIDVKADRSQAKVGVLYEEPVSLGLTKKHPVPFVFIKK